MLLHHHNSADLVVVFLVALTSTCLGCLPPNELFRPVSNAELYLGSGYDVFLGGDPSSPDDLGFRQRVLELSPLHKFAYAQELSSAQLAKWKAKKEGAAGTGPHIHPPKILRTVSSNVHFRLQPTKYTCNRFYASAHVSNYSTYCDARSSWQVSNINKSVPHFFCNAAMFIHKNYLGQKLGCRLQASLVGLFRQSQFQQHEKTLGC